MPLLPVAAPIAVRLDGRTVSAYASAYVVGGRAYAPLLPYVTRVADRIGYRGWMLVVTRGERQVRIRLANVSPGALDAQYVALAPVLRGLGESVSYDSRTHTVEVRSPQARVVASPAPFDPLAPQVAPRVVFTPAPSPMPRVIWRGPATPRRTPLPYPIPT
jgi:hypothetical protein